MPAARRGRLWPGTVPRPPRKRLRLSAEPSRRFKCGSHRIDANYRKVNRNMYFRGTTFSQICHPRTNHFNDLRPTLRSQVSKISLKITRRTTRRCLRPPRLNGAGRRLARRSNRHHWGAFGQPFLVPRRGDCLRVHVAKWPLVASVRSRASDKT
jgi:hypothetical protein